MIQEDKLIAQLNNLKQISPSDAFSKKLKGVLLSTPHRIEKKQFFSIAKFRLSIRESLGFAASVGVVAALIIILLGLTPQTAGPIVGTTSPSIESANMLNAANAAVNDINIHLDEVNSFNAAASQSGKALSDINPTSVNSESLNTENNNISASSTDNNSASQINSILDKISNE